MSRFDLEEGEYVAGVGVFYGQCGIFFCVYYDPVSFYVVSSCDGIQSSTTHPPSNGGHRLGGWDDETKSVGLPPPSQAEPDPGPVTLFQVDGLEFTTSHGRTFSYGTSGKPCKGQWQRFNVEGYELVALAGGMGETMDGIGGYFR
jgi:hypothetical protein